MMRLLHILRGHVRQLELDQLFAEWTVSAMSVSHWIPKATLSHQRSSDTPPAHLGYPACCIADPVRAPRDATGAADTRAQSRRDRPRRETRRTAAGDCTRTKDNTIKLVAHAFNEQRTTGSS